MYQPVMEPGTTEKVKTEWILKNLTGSSDGFGDGDGVDWREVIVQKLWSPNYDGLVGALAKDGFKMPICLYYKHEPTRWQLGNGHHRMAIAILLCLEEVLVYWAEDGTYMHTDKTGKERKYPKGAAERFANFADLIEL